MAFINKTDLERYIDVDEIDQITDNNDAFVDEAILDAENRIREKIDPRIDIDAEFAKTGANRNRSLLEHCINLAIYKLFKRLYTDVLPDGRVQGMEDAESWLDDIYNGRLSVTLDKKDEANQRGWPLRWGSQPSKGSQTY